MQGLFSSLADKAQSALNSTPLGRQGSNESGAPGSSSSGGILKSHAFESIHHQLRSFQQQYSSSTTPAQKIVTVKKGVALDFDNVSRDAHASSKELYMWGQSENEDIKDVTDRLAWMTYIEGSLAATLAKEIDASRAPFKALRDAESGLSGRRGIRAGLENQIARIEHDQRHGMEQKLAELKRQLRKAEEDDEPLEKEVELLKRKAIRESERMKWTAMREYAEKLSLISQAAVAALPALPDIPSSKFQPYTGATLTASLRTTLQQSLDHWQPGETTLLLREPSAADLNRSDTRSFGETHARELARINTADPHAKPSIPVTPPATLDHPPQAPSHTSNAPIPSFGTSPVGVAKSPATSVTMSPTLGAVASPPPPGSASPPLNPAVLNQSPAPIPVTATTPLPVAIPDPTDPKLKVPTITPTVAETGMPKSAGPDGPGPASGSLKDLKQPSPVSPTPSKAPAVAPAAEPTSASDALPGYGGAAKLESAEEEKKRLEREERERILTAGGSAPLGEQKFESAEEEKKRLEREERERILAAGGSSNFNPDSKQPPEGDSDLPPYQEF